MGAVNKKNLSNLSPKQMALSQKQSLHLLQYYLKNLLSLLYLHFGVTYFQEKHMSPLPPCIFFNSKFIDDVKVARARAEDCKY